MTEPIRPETETYPGVMSGLADRLNNMAPTNMSPTDWFNYRRTTWDARNPVRVVPSGHGSFQVAVVIDGRYPDVEDAQRAANYHRHALNLMWLELYERRTGDPQAKVLADEEAERYAKWRVGPDEDEEAN